MVYESKYASLGYCDKVQNLVFITIVNHVGGRERGREIAMKQTL